MIHPSSDECGSTLYVVLNCQVATLGGLFFLVSAIGTVPSADSTGINVFLISAGFCGVLVRVMVRFVAETRGGAHEELEGIWRK